MTAALTLALVVLALLGLPLFLVILGITLVGQGAAGLAAPVIFVEMYEKVTDNPIFMTIPLFAYAGFVLSESKAPQRLVALSRAMLGWMPGGSAVVTIVACALFTAFTGASGVTIIALGGLMLPVLAKERYPERFNLGLLTVGGSLGLLFPPSLPLIIFALIASPIASVGVETLFLAGIVPGLFLMVVLGVYGGLVERKHATRERIPFRFGRFFKALRNAAFDLPIPFIIIIGVFGGLLTIAQAAAAVALYVTIVEVFLYRDMGVKKLIEVTTKSTVLVGGILMIILAALAMTNFLTDQEVPARVLAAMEDHIDSQLAFLLFLNVFLLLVGCVMDIFSAILVVVPLVLPVALRFGIDPVHLGVIFLTNLEIGYCTPPIGINLFISSLRFKRPVVVLYRACLPFLGLLILCLLAITYIPSLTLSLVRHVEGTDSVTVSWSRRDVGAGGTGDGVLRWTRRDEAGPGWDVAVPPPDGAAREQAADLRLRYHPVDASHLARLEAGETDVLCAFELDRGEAAGWRVAARWQAKVRGPKDLVRREIEPDVLDIAPSNAPPALLEGGPECCSMKTVRIDRIEDGRAQGVLRSVVLHFPEDESELEHIYDLEVAFDCAIVLDVQGVRELPGHAVSREIHDCRLTYRPLEDDAPGLPAADGKARRYLVRLERTRTRPWNVQASWIVELARAEDLQGFTAAPDGVKVVLEDEGKNGLPHEGISISVAKIEIASATEGSVRGVLRALLLSPRGDYDLEVGFDLPLQDAR